MIAWSNTLCDTEAWIATRSRSSETHHWTAHFYIAWMAHQVDNLDLIDSLESLTLKRDIPRNSLCRRELAQNLITLCHLAKDSVLIVEERQIPKADEELRTT
mmetsp:Transcript_5430/g.17054  ORF Transcript_5430/g.17054 Transcript_5430/m.17054 type:complete len:102 (-) Transcript_5430:630-935(-)